MRFGCCAVRELQRLSIWPGWDGHSEFVAAVRPNCPIDNKDAMTVCGDVEILTEIEINFQMRTLVETLKVHRTRDRPTDTFRHHKPMAFGLPKQDGILLTNGEAFLDIIGYHTNVRYLSTLHIHKLARGTNCGILTPIVGYHFERPHDASLGTGIASSYRRAHPPCGF